MKNLDTITTQNIIGGAFNPSADILTILKGAIEPIYLIGQELGGALRRIVSRRLLGL